MKKQKTYSEQSSTTALGVAFRRTFTDIPLSNEIYDILKRTMTPEEVTKAEGTGDQALINLVPYFEARYWSTNEELEKSGVNQILELGSGLSPRGALMTSNHEVTRYVEFDLLDMINQKKEILKELRDNGHLEKSNRLYFFAGNANSSDDILDTCKHFKQESIAIVCEGLLRYMSFADKEILMASIVDILNRFGGVFITPDTECQDRVAMRPGSLEARDRHSERMGYDVTPNTFTDIKHARDFFRNCGFTIKERPLVDVLDQCVSIENLKLNRKMVKKMLTDWPPMFVMTM